MNYIKKILKAMAYTLISLIIGLLLITILSYFNLLNTKIINIIKIIIIIISLFIGGFITGKNSLKKGYIEGLKFGIITTLILFLANIIIYKHLKFSIIILYTIYIITCIFGGMVGIMRKRKS